MSTSEIGGSRRFNDGLIFRRTNLKIIEPRFRSRLPKTTTAGGTGARLHRRGHSSVARTTPRIPRERAGSRCGYIRSEHIGPSDDLQFDRPSDPKAAKTTDRSSRGKSESAVPRVDMAGEENFDGARASSRTPNRTGTLTEANVNEMIAPNSAAKLASFKGRWVIERALRINTPGGFSTAARRGGGVTQQLRRFRKKCPTQVFLFYSVRLFACVP